MARSRVPLISTGNERMLLDFGQANWIEKARQQSERVRMVREKIKTDSLLATIDSVGAKLDQPIPLSHSSAGVVPGLRLISEL